MEENKVWRIMTKDQVSADRRLLGTKWVFKVKKNGSSKVRLVAQGFAQIPDINLTDNFSRVIYKTTFRIILVLWATYNWETKIINLRWLFYTVTLKMKLV